MTKGMDDHSYIREVERYFLEITGQGVMLSSRDYDLIQSWKKRGVPRDVVLRGIQRALEDCRRRGEHRAPKSIYYCSDVIEQEIKSYFRNSPRAPSEPGERSEQLVDELAGRLARIISTEKSDRLRGHYAEIRRKVLGLKGLDEEEIFRRIEAMQHSLYESFFESMDEHLKHSILEDARGMIHRGGKYMTPEAYEQSLSFYRNQILEQRFNIRRLLQD